jgi:hypothetical protein
MITRRTHERASVGELLSAMTAWPYSDRVAAVAPGEATVVEAKEVVADRVSVQRAGFENSTYRAAGLAPIEHMSSVMRQSTA